MASITVSAGSNWHPCAKSEALCSSRLLLCHRKPLSAENFGPRESNIRLYHEFDGAKQSDTFFLVLGIQNALSLSHYQIDQSQHEEIPFEPGCWVSPSRLPLQYCMRDSHPPKYHTQRKPSNRDEFDGPHQLLDPPSPSTIAEQAQNLPLFPPTLMSKNKTRYYPESTTFSQNVLSILLQNTNFLFPSNQTNVRYGAHGTVSGLNGSTCQNASPRRDEYLLAFHTTTRSSSLSPF